jgi:hypothetical protein
MADRPSAAADFCNRICHKQSSGRQWIASLYGNVFRAEREISLSGPQT